MKLNNTDHRRGKTHSNRPPLEVDSRWGKTLRLASWKIYDNLGKRMSTVISLILPWRDDIAWKWNATLQTWRITRNFLSEVHATLRTLYVKKKKEKLPTLAISAFKYILISAVIYQEMSCITRVAVVHSFAKLFSHVSYEVESASDAHDCEPRLIDLRGNRLWQVTVHDVKI